MGKKALMTSIRGCQQCHSGVYTPFFFPMRDQEVMVITAAPSMQAMYRPLTSIRFFRKLCLALFGDKYLREKELCDSYLREFCGGNIYWTHYYKCFPPTLTDFSQISDVCAGTYLKSEINLLKPKQIYVFGDAIREKVKALVSNRENMCVFKPFPETGAEELFNEVRDKIKPFLKYVKKTGFANKATYSMQESNIQANEVHLRFELAAFEKVLEEQPLDTTTDSVEEIWHRKLVVPNMKRYSKLVSAYSFIENQIRVFLLDYVARTKNYTVFGNLRGAYQVPTWENVFKVIKEKPIDLLIKDYMEHAPAKFNGYNSDQFVRELKTLRMIRNQIVHEGGFIHSQKFSEGKLKENCLYHAPEVEQFPGIFVFANTIYISQEGEKKILKFVKDIVELLCKQQR